MPSSVSDTEDTVGSKQNNTEMHNQKSGEVWTFPLVPCAFTNDNEDCGKSLLGCFVVWGPWFEEQWLWSFV